MSLFEERHKAIIIEEKLNGEEFSLQSFCDGKHVIDMPPVQDHKRAYDGDSGLNTGGMGSYSCEDHGLPFLPNNYIQEASRINSAVAEALLNELNQGFKGILYGGFILTKNGLKLLEYNARFGDPEVMNVISLLGVDFINVCEAIINGTLDKFPIFFDKKATVCKYVVPKEYPNKTVKKECINIDCIPRPSDKLKVYYAAIDKEADKFYLTGSRAIAFVGIGNNLMEAEKIAEEAASTVEGPVRHRKDIGTLNLIQKRIDHIKEIINEENKSVA